MFSVGLGFFLFPFYYDHSYLQGCNMYGNGQEKIKPFKFREKPGNFNLSKEKLIF